MPLNTISVIKPYMVTIDNVNYQRYKGELAIAIKEMENDGKVNVVGYILDSAHILVDLIKPSSKIKFNIEKYVKIDNWLLEWKNRLKNKPISNFSNKVEFRSWTCLK